VAVGLGVWAVWFGYGLLFDPPKSATGWELTLAWAIFVLILAMAAVAAFVPVIRVDEGALSGGGVRAFRGLRSMRFCPPAPTAVMACVYV
jgi:hypothetical protein